MALDEQGRELEKLERRLAGEMARAVRGFSLIEEGDRILVAVSGGKDSYALVHLLQRLARRAPVRFSIVAVHVDQGQPGHDPEPLRRALVERGIEVELVRDATYPVVQRMTPPGKTPCSMCAKLRRAILYRVADELGCTKIALGHHRHDTVVTLLLNLIFSGQLKAMPPKLRSVDGRHVVIRPLIYCDEQELARLSATLGFPLLPCNVCGSQPDQQRLVVGRLLDQLEALNPGVEAQLIAAVANVRPTHLLDVGLWRRLGLQFGLEQEEEGDPAQAATGAGDWNDDAAVEAGGGSPADC